MTVHDDEKYHRESWMTDGQWACAKLFADVCCGFHHVVGKFKPDGTGVRISDFAGRWSTFDFDRLTVLVVLAHDRAIRVELEQSAPGRIGFHLHFRGTRTGQMYARHPSIENAIANVRRVHGPSTIKAEPEPSHA